MNVLWLSWQFLSIPACHKVVWSIGSFPKWGKSFDISVPFLDSSIINDVSVLFYHIFCICVSCYWVYQTPKQVINRINGRSKLVSLSGCVFLILWCYFWHFSDIGVPRFCLAVTTTMLWLETSLGLILIIKNSKFDTKGYSPHKASDMLYQLTDFERKQRKNEYVSNFECHEFNMWTCTSQLQRKLQPLYSLFYWARLQ